MDRGDVRMYHINYKFLKSSANGFKILRLLNTIENYSNETVFTDHILTEIYREVYQSYQRTSKPMRTSLRFLLEESFNTIRYSFYRINTFFCFRLYLRYCQNIFNDSDVIQMSKNNRGKIWRFICNVLDIAVDERSDNNLKKSDDIKLVGRHLRLTPRIIDEFERIINQHYTSPSEDFIQDIRIFTRHFLILDIQAAQMNGAAESGLQGRVGFEYPLFDTEKPNIPVPNSDIQPGLFRVIESDSESEGPKQNHRRIVRKIESDTDSDDDSNRASLTSNTGNQSNESLNDDEGNFDEGGEEIDVHNHNNNLILYSHNCRIVSNFKQSSYTIIIEFSRPIIEILNWILQLFNESSLAISTFDNQLLKFLRFIIHLFPSINICGEPVDENLNHNIPVPINNHVNEHWTTFFPINTKVLATNGSSCFWPGLSIGPTIDGNGILVLFVPFYFKGVKIYDPDHVYLYNNVNYEFFKNIVQEDDLPRYLEACKQCKKITKNYSYNYLLRKTYME